MPVYVLPEDDFQFPPLSEADGEGLLLVGGKLTPERVLEAYTKGIFPWFNEDELPLWWSPDPRFVLLPHELHISSSMKKLVKKDRFSFRMDTAFEEVITACAAISRKEQDGTWITREMQAVYTRLYEKGFAHCAETWYENQLVGGVYGIRIGKVFFGESMFSTHSNASKFAFIKLVQWLAKTGVELIDCQVYTTHVEKLGGRLIPRQEFVSLLEQLCGRKGCPFT